MKFINLKTKSEEAFLSSPSVLCIGNFDGVHLGHRQLVETVLDEYSVLKDNYSSLVSGAWFFDSNFYKSVDEIFSIDEKLNVFAELGLDYAIIADFNDMKSLSPEEFVKSILKTECSCIHAVCGENFRFGKMALGNAKMLSELMCSNVSVVPLLSVENHIVSSTYIRELLASGNIEDANYLLCSKYSISEKVVHGKALGRKLGIPTVNQNVCKKKLILKNGIYATVCTIDEKKYYGVTNVGVRPTVDNNEIKNVETYIIDFDGDCYDKEIKVEFIYRIRDEIRFADVNQLKQQITKDIEVAKNYFKI